MKNIKGVGNDENIRREWIEMGDRRGVGGGEGEREGKMREKWSGRGREASEGMGRERGGVGGGKGVKKGGKGRREGEWEGGSGENYDHSP